MKSGLRMMLNDSNVDSPRDEDSQAGHECVLQYLLPGDSFFHLKI